MSVLIEPLKWLLEKDVRAKNAVSVLTGLLSVIAYFFASRRTNWFQEVEAYGNLGVAISCVVVFLVSYLSVVVVWSCFAQVRQQATERQMETDLRNAADSAAAARYQKIRDQLYSLSEWQRRFVLRFVSEGRTQIPEHEVGPFRAVWEPEVSVLVNKRIVIEHRSAGVFEINRTYLDYLRDNWDEDTGSLS